MAGSRALFQYTNDAGVLYTVLTDESNAEATIGGIQASLQRSVVSPGLPGTTKRRYVNATLGSNANIKRKFYIGNPAAVLQAVNGATLSAQVYPTSEDGGGTRENWVITSYRGEASSPPVALARNDSGLTDGDGGGGDGGGGV